MHRLLQSMKYSRILTEKVESTKGGEERTVLTTVGTLATPSCTYSEFLRCLPRKSCSISRQRPHLRQQQTFSGAARTVRGCDSDLSGTAAEVSCSASVRAGQRHARCTGLLVPATGISSDTPAGSVTHPAQQCASSLCTGNPTATTQHTLAESYQLTNWFERLPAAYLSLPCGVCYRWLLLLAYWPPRMPNPAMAPT